jgi:multicomponent Na+:H+ antiporter subunit D
MNPQIWVVAPIILPLLGAAISLLAWRAPRHHAKIAAVTIGGMLAAGIALLVTTWRAGYSGTPAGSFDPSAAMLTAEVGGFVPPFGIVLVCDLLAATMVTVTGLLGLVILLYSTATTDSDDTSLGYYPLIQVMLAGAAGAYLTGDLFNLYVWIEVMLVTSFALLTLGGRETQIEGAVKYVTLNLLASMTLLTAVGLIYGLTGTLTMAHVAALFEANGGEPMIAVVASLFAVSLGIKAASFPLFFWLPASYHTAPAATSALFSGILTKVGVYVLFRLLTLIVPPAPGAYIHGLVLWAGVLTMITGVLGAVAMDEFRRILSVHIISQIGYMLVAIGLLGAIASDATIPADVARLAVAGGIYYLLHNIVVKSNLFLVGGVVERLFGSGELDDLGGLYRYRPYLAGMFFISAMSLAGLPPMSGFFAKFAVIRAALEAHQGVVAAAALGTGLLTLYSMLKIWKGAFWRPAPEDAPPLDEPPPEELGTRWRLYAPIAVLTATTLAMGLAGQPIFELLFDAAQQMLQPQAYIEGVGLEMEIQRVD